MFRSWCLVCVIVVAIVVSSADLGKGEEQNDEKSLFDKMKKAWRVNAYHEKQFESQNITKRAEPGQAFETPIMPVAGGLFHVYALPVGQGDARVLQCPNGDITIIDLGSREPSHSGFWSTDEIKAFLKDHNDRIKNIVVTHNDLDHYNLFSSVFHSSDDLRGLNNIYISCTPDQMPDTLSNWVDIIGAKDKLRTFNEGKPCGSTNNKPCEAITLCPDLKSLVLSANAASCNSPNIDSIVIGIQYNKFTVQLNGDFEDYTGKIDEDGPQKKMVDFYGSDLQVTVYMLARHGADNFPNKPVMRNAVKPKAVFVSSNPWYTYRHPRCSITDYFINELKSLCKPAETNPNSAFYCGEHPAGNIHIDEKLQHEFACGLDSVDKPRRNEYAIYSTTPSKDTVNLVHLLTDGIRWGFLNNIQKVLPRTAI